MMVTPPTGYGTRRVDTMGRVVIPLAIRRAMSVVPGDSVVVQMIQYDGAPAAVIQSFAEKCALCDRTIDRENRVPVMDRSICRTCAEKVKMIHLDLPCGDGDGYSNSDGGNE